MNSSRVSKGALPAHFVKAMRTLFDILDTERSGYIRFNDLAKKWTLNPPKSQGIPPNFVDSLRRVTPQNGLLTFERFCAGLRLALTEENNNSKPVQRVLSDPNLLRPEELPVQRRINHQQSMLFGSQHSITNVDHIPNYENHEVILRQKKMPSKFNQVKTVPPSYQHALSRSRLRQAVPPPPPPGASVPGLVEGKKPQKVEVQRFRPISAISASSGTSSMDHSKSVSPESETNGAVRMRDKSKLTAVIDSRRHTLGENAQPKLLKHERLLSEEREILNRGQDIASRLANWYSERLAKQDKRLKLLERGMVPLDDAVHEEKLNYLRVQTTEVNRKILTLMELSEKGFPSHMNLELRQNFPQPSDDQIKWLKKQNGELTDEVTEMQQQIGRLEAEKSTLITQMFQQQSLTNQRRLVRPAPQRPTTNGHAPAAVLANGGPTALARTKTFDATLM